MIDDITPRKKPVPTSLPSATAHNSHVQTAQQTPAPLSAEPQQPKFSMPKKRRFYQRVQFWVLVILGLIIIAGISTISWYQWALQPRDAGSNQKVHLVVKSGETSATIIDQLAQAGIVRSKLATRLYVELSGSKNKLQAGGYVLSSNQSVSDIINHIVAGKTDEQLVTIPPGLTLKELREVFKKYGYTDEDITKAYSTTYTSKLLSDKPADASLEGYLFPESFRVVVSEPLSSLFERSFDELYTRLVADGMIEKFKAHGLNLHQAMTLASIVQKEVSNPVDQKQVAQVFYSRLSANMVLGSDVTFEYAAALLGVTPAVNIDSPYNTRQNPGLPPGPIANTNYSALQAVADPAPGDYLYFVAGDDGKTYYGRTVEDHEANVANYCHDLCNIY